MQDFADFDYILAMDRDNLQKLQKLKRSIKTNIPKLAEPCLFMNYLSEKTGENEVPDPYYGDLRGFEEIHAMLLSAGTAFLKVAKTALD